MPDSPLVEWLETRLQEEQTLLQHRHHALLEDFDRRLQASCGDGAAPEQLATSVDARREHAEPSSPLTVEVPLQPPQKSNLTDSPGSTAKQKRPPKGKTNIFRPDEIVVGGPLLRLVKKHYFESFFAALIIFNAAVMAVEVQITGHRLGAFLENPGQDLPVSDDSFLEFLAALDVVLGVLFWIELFLKFVATTTAFFCSAWNMFDLVVMLTWTVDKIQIGEVLMINPKVFRIFRLARLMRLGRLTKVDDEIFDTLILMLSCVRASFWVLLWSMVLLIAIMFVASLALNSFLHEYMSEGPVDQLVARKTVFAFFGSFTRSLVTLFEITLGNWAPVTRCLLDNVSEWYALGILAYKVVVGFGVIQVIRAIFIQQTMQCALNDDAIMIRQRTRTKKHFAEKMGTLFHETDTDGDGTMSKDEFGAIINDQRVKMWLQAMEMNIRDPERFFAMLDRQGAEELDADDLIAGMANLKGPATQLHMEMTERIVLKHLRDIEAGQGSMQRELASCRSQLRGLHSEAARHEAAPLEPSHLSCEVCSCPTFGDKRSPNVLLLNSSKPRA